MKKYFWKKTKTPGVRYREHPTRKNGVKFDKYFTIRYNINGKTKEEALGWETQGWTEKKAAAKLSELREAQRTGVGAKTLSEKRKIAKDRAEQEALEQEIIKKENITFSEVFEKYITQAHQDKCNKTCIEEQGAYNKWIKPLCGHISLKLITPFLLEKLKKKMSDDCKAPRTIAYTLAIIRQVFNYAKNHSLYNGDNPVSKVKKPSEDNKRVRFLTHEEAGILLKELNEVSPSLHDMALLSLHCGLRAGEIFNLTWREIDFCNENILIKDTKSGKNRNAVMTREVKNMLQKRKSAHDSNIKLQTDIIFPSKKGEKTTEVSRAFDRTVEKLGFNKGNTDRRQKLVFHSLRHTYASWLVMSGVDLYTVQKLMGHSTISMTERYAHLAPDHLKKAVSMLEKSLKQSNIVEFKNLKKGFIS